MKFLSNFLYLVTIPLILSIGCKQNAKTSEVPLEQSIEIPEEFVQFYDKFHTDSLFQINHIVFPLDIKSDSTKWTKNTWRIHKPFDDQGGSYIREFDNFAGIITETITEKTGAFIIVRRFSKMNGEYQLIYYTLINRAFQDWEKTDS